MKPGDKLAFAGTDTTVVMSDSVPLKTPIAKAPGAGRPNPLCADHKPRDESKVDPDNHHSAGFVMNYGRFRTIDLGDLTWSREFMLMCPNNPIGTVDLYLTNHHGLDQSGAPAFVHAIQPRVAIMNNGTRKGGAVQTFQTLETSPGLEDVWQLHWSYAGGVEHNAPGVMIANIDAGGSAGGDRRAGAATPPAGAGGMAAHSPAHYIKVSARTDGSFTVTNSGTDTRRRTRLGRKDDFPDVAAGLHQAMGFGSLLSAGTWRRPQAGLFPPRRAARLALDRVRNRALLFHRSRAQRRSGNREALAQQAHEIDLCLRAVQHRNLQQPPFEREQIDVAAEVRRAHHVEDDVDAVAAGQRHQRGGKIARSCS